MAKHKLNPFPPRWADFILRWVCPANLQEELQGDLHEQFIVDCDQIGGPAARRRYIIEVLKFARPYFLKRKLRSPGKPLRYPSPFFANPEMIHNYFKIAFRTVVKHRMYSMLNIGGLALGLTASLLLFLWVQQEQAVDDFHEQKDLLFMVYERAQVGGKTDKADTPQVLANELKQTIPEIQYATGFAWEHNESFRSGGQIHKMKGSRAGNDFFKMFSYPLLEGTVSTALSAPNSVAISQKMAELFFGNAKQAIGQPIRFDNRKDLVVTAVFENIPANSTDQFDYLLNWDAWVMEEPLLRQWGANFVRTYVQLRPDADPALVDSKIKNFIDPYIKNLKKPSGDFKIDLALQPFSERYLHSAYINGKPAGGRITYVWLFSGVGLFILLIACINFMNLATAMSLKRSKEIGIRKVVGSARSGLIAQLFVETWLLTLVAVLLALVISWLSLPYMADLTGRPINLPLKSPTFWLALTGLVFFTGLVAGSYPALYLSSLNPVHVLKGKYHFSGVVSIRQGLVGFQFTLSVLFIIATSVVSKQTKFLQTKETGYDRSGILYIPIEAGSSTRYEVFRGKALELPGVLGVDLTSEPPHAMGSKTHNADWTGKSPATTVNFYPTSVGYDFVKVMGLKMVEGRDFSRAFATDTNSYILNEQAIKQMGLKDPIGKSFSMYGNKGVIIGVMKDFHFNSLRQLIEPLVISIDENLNFGNILVRTQPGKTREALTGLKNLYKNLNPEYPFTFSFLDQQYSKQYRSEQIIETITRLFSGLAIFIASLGLFGLAAITADQRTKEIGIRKVLGASVTSIVTLLSSNFLKLVVISILIASPIAWFVMHRWLQEFAYKVDIGWGIFGYTAFLALGIALVTVSYQSITAALLNPIKSLKSE